MGKGLCIYRVYTPRSRNLRDHSAYHREMSWIKSFCWQIHRLREWIYACWSRGRKGNSLISGLSLSLWSALWVCVLGVWSSQLVLALSRVLWVELYSPKRYGHVLTLVFVNVTFFRNGVFMTLVKLRTLRWAEWDLEWDLDWAAITARCKFINWYPYKKKDRKVWDTDTRRRR